MAQTPHTVVTRANLAVVREVARLDFRPMTRDDREQYAGASLGAIMGQGGEDLAAAIVEADLVESVSTEAPPVAIADGSHVEVIGVDANGDTFIIRVDLGVTLF